MRDAEARFMAFLFAVKGLNGDLVVAAADMLQRDIAVRRAAEFVQTELRAIESGEWRRVIAEQCQIANSRQHRLSSLGDDKHFLARNPGCLSIGNKRTSVAALPILPRMP